MSDIVYKRGNCIHLDQFIEVYESCTLGRRRPTQDKPRMAAMLANANLFISAWDSSLLVGFARAVSDYSYATYVIDLAVREQYQRKGVGRRLLAEVKALGGPDTSLILLATPGAETYYPHLGFTRHDSAWILRPGQNLY